MYLAYLIAVLFILVFYALQKYVAPGGGQLERHGAVALGVKASGRKKQKNKNVRPTKAISREKDGISVKTFVIVGVIALAIRMVMGYFLKGYPSDMSCWIAWGNKVLNGGMGHFYAPDYFCDYPPGYITVLGFFAWINEIFGLTENATQLCFKLPGIFSDTILMASIFVIGSKHMSKKSALFLGIIYMLNPLMIVNSAAWGQVESVLAMFLVLAMYNLYKKNYYLSGTLYVLAVLIKPQALMVGPVFLFAFLAAKDWKMILKMIGIGIVLVLLFSIPYNYEAWTNTAAGFGTKFISALNPMWLIEKYKATLASYPYFTINAFNFYAMLKLNWTSLEMGGTAQTMLNILNYVLILGAVGVSLLLFIKIKSPSGKIFIPSFFIIAFLFTFGLKMHERYMITPIIFLIFEYMLSKNKRTLWIFALFSSVNFINVFCVLRYILMFNTSGPPYQAMAVASMLEVITFIVTMFVLIHDYVLYPRASARNAGEYQESPYHGMAAVKALYGRLRGEEPQSAPVQRQKAVTEESDVDLSEPTPLDNWIKKLKGAYFMLTSKISGAVFKAGKTERPQTPVKSEKLLRIDYIILTVIVVLYAVVAYTNLGSVHNPQTFYQPQAVNEEVEIDLGSTQTVDTVTYYLGIGDVANKPEMKLSYSTDGRTWTDMNAACQLKSVFKWEVVKLNAPVQARYIRGVTNAVDYRMFEIAFWNQGGELIPISSVSGSGDCANIADEQEYAQYRTSYMNSTYFDEIYHPRTAYEHLHLMPYYETTHPPLGKLIMSVGIAIFGMTPFGWRVMGTTFGIIMLPLLYVLLKKLFERTRYSVLGTLIFAFDFMHFSLTRLGTIDSYPVTFIIAMYLFMFLFGKRVLDLAKNNPSQLKEKKTFLKLMGTLALSGIMFGLGAASKWICLYAGAGLAVEFLLIMIGVYIELPKNSKKLFTGFAVKTCLSCVVLFILVPGTIYLLSYLPISMVEGYPNVWETMLRNQTYMYNYHSKLESTHPYSSYWYQWPIDYRPLWAYSAPVETVGQENIGCVSVFGNPLIFWTGIAAFIYTVVAGIIKRDKKVLFIVVGLLAQILPWVFVTRCVFIYHFFASVPFIIIMIVYAFKDMEERFGWFRHISNWFVVLCGLLFAGFYPVLSATTVTKDYSNIWLKWFNTWVFHNRGN